MKALLVLVHGSPRPESNEDMYRVVELVRRSGTHPIVEVGFLDVNQPDIPAAILACVERGATSIIAVPYFLHSGRHVTIDIPDLLEEGSRRHAIPISMGPFLGSLPQIADVIRDRVRATGG